MTERTTVRLPSDLVARAKHKAVAEGRTLTSLIEEGLRAVVDRPKPPRRKRVLPRISKARGGLLPGITLAEVEEREDLEYVERMKHLK
jgi:hypothetical protein